jgi:hypothetical protein
MNLSVMIEIIIIICIYIYMYIHIYTSIYIYIHYHNCRDDLSLMGADSGFTSLVWPLGGEDPDDAFSSVPYEKVIEYITYSIILNIINTLSQNILIFLKKNLSITSSHNCLKLQQYE